MIPFGWSGSENGLICGNDPITGGIIDQEIASKKWFLIFLNPVLEMVGDLPSRDAAIAEYNKKIAPIKKMLKIV